jgi:hypothetical protein
MTAQPSSEDSVAFHEWEGIDTANFDTGYAVTNRMPVKGGWLYVYENWIDGRVASSTMAFVPGVDDVE